MIGPEGSFTHIVLSGSKLYKLILGNGNLSTLMQQFPLFGALGMPGGMLQGYAGVLLDPGN